MTTTLIIKDPVFLEHLPLSEFPPEIILENACRYAVIEKAVAELNLPTINPRLATEAELELCHSHTYIEKVKKETQDLKNNRTLRGHCLSTDQWGDTKISEKSFTVANYAVGAVLLAIDEVMNDKAKNAFCIVRPPGHHAHEKAGEGFCIFNNVAVGARYVQKVYGISRVLICDWDTHHGNGTQDIFEKDPSVFYFSTHQSVGYPGTGFADETGAGNICNVPIVPGKNARNNILKAFLETLPEKMKAFQPEFVLISCGFDARENDPIGLLNLTDEDFSTLTRAVKQIADRYAKGRLVSVLEGGYNLLGIASAAKKHVEELI